jgi:hypothetical protein
MAAFPAITTGQKPAVPLSPEDTSNRGRYIQRTMNLLASSIPEKKNTVKVMVYGQSLSVQDWWLKVKKHLEKRWPHADLVMKNKAVGGFSAQFLKKTTRMDLLNFYPDLVIFHVFGGNKDYENIIMQIRSLTAAEVAVWTDPGRTPDKSWEDTMSLEYIPQFAEKYKLELMQIRPLWTKYMETHNITHDSLTKDGTHLNAKGNELLGQLIAPYLVRKSKWEADPFELSTTYRVGKDVQWEGDTLRLPFSGNRVDAIAKSGKKSFESCARVFIDGNKPSNIPSCYNMTRPNKDKDCWAWCVGTMIRVDHTAPWVPEHWTLTVDSITPNHSYFEFHVKGSRTGFDGYGTSKEKFVSRSGKVIIEAGDAEEGGYWHIKRAHRVTDLNINKGYTIEWNTYLMGTDLYTPKLQRNPAIENTTTLAKGFPNGSHVLTLVCEAEEKPAINAIRVYNPLLNREGRNR